MKSNQIDESSRNAEIRQEQTATDNNREFMEKKPRINEPDKTEPDKTEPDKINPDITDPNKINPDENIPTRKDKPPFIISKL